MKNKIFEIFAGIILFLGVAAIIITPIYLICQSIFLKEILEEKFIVTNILISVSIILFAVTMVIVWRADKHGSRKNNNL